MILIEQLDENAIYLLCILLTLILIILSWLSTNVREFVLPGNLLVIERRSRRLYAASANGNLDRIINPQLSPTASTPVQTNLSNNTEIVTEPIPFVNPSANSSSQIDLVDEMVEQALVDNLLDGAYYSTNHGNTVNRVTNQQPSTVNETLNAENQSTDSNEEDSELNTENVGEFNNPTDLLINILIKFVNEKEMRIKARPNDTILLLKRTHFATELNSSKIVRFIYQGQFLCDKNTIRSYNIRDQTTIHCHITSKQPTANQLNSADFNNTSNIRQRISNHQISSIARITGGQSNQVTDDSTSNNGINATNNMAADDATATTLLDNQSTTNSANSIRVPLNRNRNRRVNHHQMINTATIINVDLTNIFLPFFAVLLGSFWYIRVHFKHFFTPFSTLVLILISFIYALFLFNNIYTSSFVDGNHQLITNRIFNRRPNRIFNQPQAQTVQN